MEIVNHRQKMLDAAECNAKGNGNFATKVISMDNEEKNLEEEGERIKLIYFLSY